MLQPEQILHNRYQLKQQLGQIAGRQTWLAQDLAIQPPEPVVLKLLICGESMQWHDLTLFEREAQVLRQLNHPQIPKYRDSFSIDDRLLWFGLVQEYIPGASLKQLLAQGKHFHQRQVRQIATNLLHLLIYLHELSPPVLHRDIKPSNLIWGEDDYIYLVDFGAVQDKAAAEGSTFTVVGTYGYAPMEQFGGRAVAASDLYALGATLIHLLTGVSPAQLPHKDLRIQFADRVSLDSSFVEWIEQMTEPDVARRFQTARQALEALRATQEPHTEQTPPSEFAGLPANARQPELSHERSLTFTPRRLHRTSSNAFNTKISLYPLGIRISKFFGSVFARKFSPWCQNQNQLVLHQTNEDLLIKVPNIRINPWELAVVVPIVSAILFISPRFITSIASIGLPLVYILFIAINLLFFALSIYWKLLPVFVQFSAGKFSIYKKPFGTNFKIANGSIEDISDVFHTLKTFWNGKHIYKERVVIIQTIYREYYFGKQLSWAECRWLVDVIQDWLNLR
jgi:serine/threonine protein kinase